VVVLGASVLASEVVGRRLRIAAPVLLLACGALLGFVPALRGVALPPEVVLLLFLPALLYWESLTTSLQEIRSNLRGVVLTSTLLVILTAWAVAAVLHALGLPWGPAWVLGAAVAPTDATALSIVAPLLPRRMFTVLRAESLVNDGTALVVYGLAVGVTVGSEHLTLVHVSWMFVLAYAGGAAAGAVTALVGARLRGLLEDPLLGNVAVLLIPFTAFLLAEAIHASGVLAVVSCGLIMSQVGPRIGAARTRQQTQAFWSLATFVLNGVLFVLVGLQAQTAIRGLSSVDLARALGAVAAVCVMLVAVRIVFLFVAVFFIRTLDRRPAQLLRRVSHRSRIVSGLSGFRGAVSLAAALAVPQALDSGAGFPDRDVIVFVTFGVIVVTLVVQSLVLPGVVRWAHLPEDGRAAQERHLADTVAAESALAALPQVAAELNIDAHIVERLRHEYDKHLKILRADGADPEEEPALRYDRQYTALRLALLARKRATVVRLRDERQIDDAVLRQVQARLDIEEVRLSRRELVE
jgi:Na+/H+ antiporter